MRKNIVVGNWKMNVNREDGVALVKECLDQLTSNNNIEIVFAPSFIHLYKVAKMSVKKKNVFVASQDCSANSKGAFTGEVSAKIIASCGVKYIILGHSERRVNFNEDSKLLQLKIKQAFASNLKVIFCCGETLEKRNNKLHFEWIESQLSEALFHFSAIEFSQIVIAYEPIWAIGTGITATASQAQEMHAFIRKIIVKKYGENVAESTSILYGGSCNPLNASELFSQQDVDGGLIGGASLNSDDFIAITNLL